MCPATIVLQRNFPRYVVGNGPVQMSADLREMPTTDVVLLVPLS
jgi:hypothetical protein